VGHCLANREAILSRGPEARGGMEMLQIASQNSFSTSGMAAKATWAAMTGGRFIRLIRRERFSRCHRSKARRGRTPFLIPSREHREDRSAHSRTVRTSAAQGVFIQHADISPVFSIGGFQPANWLPFMRENVRSPGCDIRSQKLLHRNPDQS
jgi:hypothetical protein